MRFRLDELKVHQPKRNESNTDQAKSPPSPSCLLSWRNMRKLTTAASTASRYLEPTRIWRGTCLCGAELSCQVSQILSKPNMNYLIRLVEVIHTMHSGAQPS